MNKCLILPVGLFFRCGNIFNYFIVLFNRNYKHQNLFPAVKHLLPRKWQQVLLFVKTRIFRRPWNISSFSSDRLEVVRESCSSYFHVEIFELVVFDCMFSYSRGFFICLVLGFFKMSIVSIVLWSFHGRNLTAWQQLWVTGPDTTLNVPIVKRDLPDSPPGSPCFCPFCLRKLPSDICLESYRT